MSSSSSFNVPLPQELSGGGNYATLRAAFAQRNLQLVDDDEQLTQLVQRAGGNLNDLNAVFQAFLRSDLRVLIKQGTLDSGMFGLNLPISFLSGDPHLVQVLDSVLISHSSWWQQKQREGKSGNMTNMQRPKNQGQNNQNNQGDPNQIAMVPAQHSANTTMEPPHLRLPRKRTRKFCLSDGTNTCFGLEKNILPDGLSIVGCKFLLHSQPKIIRGLIMLKPENITLVAIPQFISGEPDEEDEDGDGMGKGGRKGGGKGGGNGKGGKGGGRGAGNFQDGDDDDGNFGNDGGGSNFGRRNPLLNDCNDEDGGGSNYKRRKTMKSAPKNAPRAKRKK